MKLNGLNDMNDFGLITARDPKGEYHAMTDVIHKVLNDLVKTVNTLNAAVINISDEMKTIRDKLEIKDH